MKFKQYLKEKEYMSIISNLINENKSIMDCELRMGSDAWCEFIQIAKKAKQNNEVSFNESDEFLLTTDLGEKAVVENEEDLYEAIAGGKEVELDSPKRTPPGDSKKFMVYVNSGKKNKDGQIIAKLIKWGDPNLTIKNDDDGARKSFLARHKCDTKTDRKTAGWWACNVARYAKQLGLQSTKPW